MSYTSPVMYRPDNIHLVLWIVIFLPLTSGSLYVHSFVTTQSLKCIIFIPSSAGLCSFWAPLFILRGLLLLLPFRSHRHFLTLSLSPKMLLLSEMSQPFYCMFVPRLCNDAFLFAYQSSVILHCCLCFIFNLERSTITLPKAVFAESYMHFSDFCLLLVDLFFMKNWHIAFLVHDAWRSGFLEREYC